MINEEQIDKIIKTMEDHIKLIDKVTKLEADIFELKAKLLISQQVPYHFHNSMPCFNIPCVWCGPTRGNGW